VVVAPRGLATDLERCLEERLHESVTDPAFVTAAAAARRTLDPARGEAARAELQAALARATRFLPVLRAAVDKVRR
jgi:hypothetical protein